MPNHLFNNFIKWLDCSIFSRECLVCEQNTATCSICAQCEKQLPWTRPATKTFAWGSVNRLFHYQAPVKHWITQLKFQQHLAHGASLGGLLANAIERHYQTSQPSVIIPMPLHPHRVRQRGFNQAYELARPVGKRLGVPIDIHSATRIKATKAQSGLGRDDRKQNVSNAFISKALPSAHILLIDDVITTGNTSCALADTLIHAGAKKVDVWCIASA